MKEKKNISEQRREFFTSIGKTTVVGILASVFPFKFLRGEEKKSSTSRSIIIEENPFAVKRNKR